MSLSGTEFVSFASALLLLGVGWNFLYIGGTTLLTGTYTEPEKGRAQATNDMTIFGVGLVSSLGAGLMHQLLGWQTLNLLLLPWLGTASLALVWLAAQRRRGALAGAE
jgi:MFS family permease